MPKVVFVLKKSHQCLNWNGNEFVRVTTLPADTQRSLMLTFYSCSEPCASWWLRVERGSQQADSLFLWPGNSKMQQFYKAFSESKRITNGVSQLCLCEVWGSHSSKVSCSTSLTHHSFSHVYTYCHFSDLLTLGYKFWRRPLKESSNYLQEFLVTGKHNPRSRWDWPQVQTLTLNYPMATVLSKAFWESKVYYI